MIPNQQPAAPTNGGSSSSSSANKNRPRRQPNLSPPLPQRHPTLTALPPLYLPTNSAPSTCSNANAISQQVSSSELDRIKRIGSGTWGTVYKVVQRPTARLFALKVIYGHHDDCTFHRIQRAMEFLRDVDHPNIVKCHQMYEHNGEVQVLTEFMDCGSLEGTQIYEESRLSDLAQQILSGLNYLHRLQIVHRDIKPSNLLINSKNKVKIADFRVSRVLTEIVLDTCKLSVDAIAYMSPERINTDLKAGLDDAYAGDIWSLGLSILEIYLGRFPFAVGKQGDWALMCAICKSQPPAAPPNASDEFRDFISCCLQRDPSRRWTAGRLLQHPFIVRGPQMHTQV